MATPQPHHNPRQAQFLAWAKRHSLIPIGRYAPTDGNAIKAAVDCDHDRALTLDALREEIKGYVWKPSPAATQGSGEPLPRRIPGAALASNPPPNLLSVTLAAKKLYLVPEVTPATPGGFLIDLKPEQVGEVIELIKVIEAWDGEAPWHP